MRQVKGTGSNISPYRRYPAQVPDGAIDAAVLRGLDRAIAQEDPDSKRIFLRLQPGALTGLLGHQRGDVISGRVALTLQNAAAVLPSIRDGKLRALAVTSLERSPNMPELPTVAESGFPGFEATSWFALLAPKGTPKPILEKVRAASLKVLADPDMVQKFATIGLEPVGSTGEQTREAIATDIPKWGKVIRDAGIKVGP